MPTLATAAEYFFKEGALGKRLRPTVLLLVASALDTHGPPGAHLCAVDHAPPRETPTGACVSGFCATFSPTVPPLICAPKQTCGAASSAWLR